jgi:hypothetical protein
MLVFLNRLRASLAGREIQACAAFLLVLAGFAVLFNPLHPVHFRRDEWAWIDILAVLTFLICPPTKPKPHDDVDQN